MKVLWICHFSNPEVRAHLNLKVSIVELLIRKYLKKHKSWKDFAKWISNGIKEFEKFNDIELHVVSPHYGIKKRINSFELNGIFYHFFKPDDDSIIKKIRKSISKNIESDYEGNRKVISSLIESINPDVIHMYGAENPYYSISALDIDLSKYPLMVSLQTLMSDSVFLKNYPIDNRSYNFRSSIEQKIIKRIDYIGSSVQKYRQVIWSSFNPKAIFFKTYLAVEEKVDIINMDKKYDFVFFAANISKAVDYAIEAFALAKRKHDNITLHVIGDYDDSLMAEIKQQLERIGILEGIDFTGKLPTYNDVINEIRKARFALIPLKVDMISGTVRESMANGLPVITTITPLTPELNSRRDSVLLSEKGDFQTMADNMCRLIEDDMLVETLKENGYLTVREMYDNNHAMKVWKNYYELIVKSK